MDNIFINHLNDIIMRKQKKTNWIINLKFVIYPCKIIDILLLIAQIILIII